MFKQFLQTSVLAMASALWVSSGSAAILDFEDLALATTANVGGSMTTGGVTITMQNYIWPAGTVYSGGHADITLGFTGVSFGTNHVLYPNNINALFDYAGTIGQQALVTIPFHDGGGNVNLHVNPAMGGAIVNAPNFMDPAINGATINGVSINVTGTTQQGFINLTGPVNQVLIGGQETLIDNVRSSIPEPTSAGLFALAVVPAMIRRRSAAN